MDSIIDFYACLTALIDDSINRSLEGKNTLYYAGAATRTTTTINNHVQPLLQLPFGQHPRRRSRTTTTTKSVVRVIVVVVVGGHRHDEEEEERRGSLPVFGPIFVFVVPPMLLPAAAVAILGTRTSITTDRSSATLLAGSE